MWAERIADCIEDKTKRCYLLNLPIELVGSKEYIRDTWYWLDYAKLNKN